MKNISPILHSLGLADSEIKTYLTALESGASTVLELTKLSGLSRQATYTAIESLTKRGLMSSMMHGKKRYYSAEHPARLLDYARRHENEMKEHIQELERSLPELELAIGGEKPTIKTYEGKEGIRAIIDDIKQSNARAIEEISDLDAMYTIIRPDDLVPMRKQLRDVGTRVTGLYAGKLTPKTITSERFILSKDLSGFQANITVYGSKIALVTFAGKIHSVIVDNEAIAKAFHILFSLAKESAKQKFPTG